MPHDRSVRCGLQCIQCGEGLGGMGDDPCLLSEFPDGSLLGCFPKLDLASWETPKSGIWGVGPTHKNHCIAA